MFVVTLPETADPDLYATSALEAGADVLEIRGDKTPDLSNFASPVPLLIAPRGTGNALIDVLHPAYVDLELNEECSVDRSNYQLIRSYHNYEKTPALDELIAIVDELLAGTPDIIKIATHINTYEDLQTLQKLHKAIDPSQPRVLLGMGRKAHLNRLLSPLNNALTYTYLNKGEEAATGQVPLSFYKNLAECSMPNLYGILGGLDVHTLSPTIHNALFQKHNLDALYATCLTEDLEDAWKQLTSMGLKGFSVTSPYKRDIIEYMDVLHPHAEQLQSVNTAVLQGEQWHGYSTDAIGLIEGYDFWPTVKQVAIIGSGGVVPTVIDACRSSGVEHITVFARNEAARKELASRLEVTQESVDALGQSDADLTVCTVSNDVSFALPQGGANAQALDLRYGKTTKFMADANQKGYTVHSGLPMLIHQALAQFQLFTGLDPDEGDAALLHSLLS